MFKKSKSGLSLCVSVVDPTDTFDKFRFAKTGGVVSRVMSAEFISWLVSLLTDAVGVVLTPLLVVGVED